MAALPVFRDCSTAILATTGPIIEDGAGDEEVERHQEDRLDPGDGRGVGDQAAQRLSQSDASIRAAPMA